MTLQARWLSKTVALNDRFYCYSVKTTTLVHLSETKLGFFLADKLILETTFSNR